MLQFNHIINVLSAYVTGWPLIIFILAASIYCTVAFGWVQFAYFAQAVKMILFPAKEEFVKDGAQINPFQAFLNTLSMGLGNGSIAGVATSIYSGGPGSLFWLVVIGLLLMAVRFAEVYLSIHYADYKARIGGPIAYLKQLFGGKVLSFVYAVLTFIFANLVGNGIQTNAISISLQTIAGVNPVYVALFFLVFVLYMMLGGAQRILALSDKIVPLKVFLFFSGSFIVLAYHWQALLPSLLLILRSAFSYTALAGGALGYTVQQAMRFGMMRIAMASEAGLGTSGIFFGACESKNPLHDALMSMVAVFMSTVVCLLVGLCIIMSGVWDSGLTSTALTIASYKTVFGELGGWIVTILSICFGLGVVVSYAFVSRTIWMYLTSHRYELVGNIIYCLCACLGALCDPYILWAIGDIINAGMLVLNITAIILLSKVIRDGINGYKKRSA